MAGRRHDIDASIFSNPLCLPLEQLYLKVRTIKGVQEIKALDKFWVSFRVYPSYTSIPNDSSEESTIAWMKRSTNFLKALIFLQKLKYYKFWSYVIYDRGVTQMLNSFLKKAVPPYEEQPDGDFGDLYSRIFNLVFCVYKRILTPSDSKTEFMLEKTVGKLLLDNNIITNAKIWDLVRIYGMSDETTLLSMLNFTYGIMPQLKDDLRESLIHLVDIFDSIGTAAYENAAITEALILKFTYLLFDTIYSIHMFIKVYEPFKNLCITEDFYSKIVHVYENDISLLLKLMKSVLINDAHQAYDRVDDARVEFLEICHELLSSCLNSILQAQENEVEQNEWINNYFNLISATIVEKEFLRDFNAVYPFVQDIEMLTSISPNIDQEKIKCILSTLNEYKIIDDDVGAAAATLPKIVENLKIENEENEIPEYLLHESKITQVLDVLPDLGYGFIERCLLAMNNDPQAVIMAVLENNLPPDLANLDKALPLIPPETEPVETEIVEAAYIGKKPSKYKSMNEMLNDKSLVKKQKDKFSIYGLIPDDELLYNDDYFENAGTRDVVILDEDDREKVPKLRDRFNKSDEEESEQETDEDKPENSRPKRDAFCEDPAILRARREAKYQQKYSARNRDVIGKPKGQGQEKSVTVNRDRKNKHKSSVSNHNRKSGAQWKRSKGFIPS